MVKAKGRKAEWKHWVDTFDTLSTGTPEDWLRVTVVATRHTVPGTELGCLRVSLSLSCLRVEGKELSFSRHK